MFGLLLLLAATAANAEVTVLAGGRLIDGYGGPPIENAVIVIDGNTIRKVPGYNLYEICLYARLELGCRKSNRQCVMSGVPSMTALTPS